MISVIVSHENAPKVVVCQMSTFALTPLFTAVAMTNWSGSSYAWAWLEAISAWHIIGGGYARLMRKLLHLLYQAIIASSSSGGAVTDLGEQEIG